MLFFKKKQTRYKPSIALSERAETIGDTYKEGYFNDDEFKFNDCQNPKRYTDTFNVIVDDFGEDNAKQWHLPTCAGEYATIVKTRTEKMYPVSFFKDICNEAEGNPSGHSLFYDMLFFHFKIIMEKTYNFFFFICFEYRKGLSDVQNKKDSSPSTLRSSRM